MKFYDRDLRLMHLSVIKGFGQWPLTANLVNESIVKTIVDNFAGNQCISAYSADWQPISFIYMFFDIYLMSCTTLSPHSN